MTNKPYDKIEGSHSITYPLGKGPILILEDGDEQYEVRGISLDRKKVKFSDKNAKEFQIGSEVRGQIIFKNDISTFWGNISRVEEDGLGKIVIIDDSYGVSKEIFKKEERRLIREQKRLTEKIGVFVYL